MAIRQNKNQDEDKPSKRFPLVGSIEGRSSATTKDQRFINLYPEVSKNKETSENYMALIKRPGTSLNSTVVVAGATARGIYYWNGNLWSIWGNAVYRGTTLTATTLDTSTGKVGFVESAGANNYLFFCDGEDGYYINTSNTITKITDADFPTPHIPTPVFMDGYIFVAKSGTGDIYNCALEDPSTWNNEFINTEMFPDNIVGLSRMSNQVVAYGRMSTEFFYDAGNVSTSPLSKTDGAGFHFGACAPSAAVSTEQYMIVPTQADQGGRSVHMFKGFETKKISTEYVDKILDAEGTNIGLAAGYTVKVDGHYLYIINLTARTLVYDLETQFWTEWSTNSAGTHSKFAYNYAADNVGGKLILQHNTDGKTYLLDPALYTDAGTTILVEGVTKRFDSETMSRKFNHGLYWVADDPGSTAILSFRWSDDDYQTWSNWKTVDLHKRAFFPRAGAFRRRAFNFTYQNNLPLRLEAIEFTDMQTGMN